MLILGLDGYDVEWAEGLPLDYDQKDAAFYCTGSSSWIGTLRKDGFEVDIYCDGEMRARVLVDENRYETLSSGPELIDHGVKNDLDLSTMVVEWGMNPWFDLYCQGVHLDAVTHEITDAVASAKAYLEETIVNANNIEFEFGF
jgi:hypothetical protein